MSAQPAIVPTHRPRWTPAVVPDPEAAPPGVDGWGVDEVPGAVAPDPSRATASRGPAARPQRGGPTGPHGPDVGHLAPPTRAAAWRRRAAVAAVPVAIALALTGLVGGGTADAELADPVAGTVTLAPGDTLWDVAAATAPAGTDTRDQLARIVELNGLDGDGAAPWTVILLPAR